MLQAKRGAKKKNRGKKDGRERITEVNGGKNHIVGKLTRGGARKRTWGGAEREKGTKGGAK